MIIVLIEVKDKNIMLYSQFIRTSVHISISDSNETDFCGFETNGIKQINNKKPDKVSFETNDTG